MAKDEKTYTQEEVNKLLAKEKTKLHETAVTALVKKNAQLKEDAALAGGQDDFLNLNRWEAMKKVAQDMITSGALPAGDNALKVVMKMQAGQEMGMKPIEAINSLYVVNGVISIWGKAVTRRLREHGWAISFEDKEDACTATATKGDESYSATMTFKMAQDSKWVGSPNLKVGWLPGANRTLKLRYGALSMLVKTNLAEVMGSAAEIAEVAEDTVPLYQQKAIEGSVKVENGDEPAAESVIESIKNMGGVLPDEVTSGERQLTKQEGADMIRELMAKKGKKNG